MKFPVDARHTESDFKVEILANEMLEAGISLDQILVSPQGEFVRGYRKDIADLAVLEDQLGNPMYYQIKTSRDGLYDGLPENIFHDNLEDVRNNTYKDPVELIKKNRQEEEAARKFFQVVENEFFRLRILFEKEERKTIIGTPQFEQHEIFLHLWQELNVLDSRYIVPLMQILPLVTKYQMRLPEVEQFLFFLLQVHVSVDVEDSSAEEIHMDKEFRIGDGYLGTNSVLGSVFYDFDPVFRLKIGPLSSSELEEFMPGMPAAMALDVFTQYYFPLQSKIIIDYVLEEKDCSLILESESFTMDSGPKYARLGISTFI